MRSGSSKNKRTPRQDAGAEGEAAARPDVDFDTQARTIKVCDARLINATQRAFCRRLLEAAARRPGIGKAEVDLASASCRIEFAGQAGKLAAHGRLLRGLRAGSGEWISRMARSNRFGRKPPRLAQDDGVSACE